LQITENVSCTLSSGEGVDLRMAVIIENAKTHISTVVSPNLRRSGLYQSIVKMSISPMPIKDMTEVRT